MQAASEGVAAAQKAVTDLRAPPTSILCAGCQNQVPVPPALFEWKCEVSDLFRWHMALQIDQQPHAFVLLFVW